MAEPLSRAAPCFQRGKDDFVTHRDKVAHDAPYVVTTGLDPVVHADLKVASIAGSSPAMTLRLSPYTVDICH
jgi:hypothetical protein